MPDPKRQPMPGKNTYAKIACPICLANGHTTSMVASPIFLRGPDEMYGNALDQITPDPCTYDYVCPSCGFVLNYPVRLLT